ncbi:cytochrome c biogenesis heme-transporting ATPase CcmA [Thalassotalea marina]|uniref:Cytochrome c biogenesis ATP-binding export protein CcmA n=1 Tax=Thalassotalea marina TaxID=1673741 RepID=A0A919BB53_9GAMM|nr:cytochrome c biogenesis heme-transporting ATPase CcmA [Thalassotalea marina]GHF77504.1 cytochrome c biogenesis ATP-binding export protein CcmA [Thalassotalea marina]
MSDRVSPLLQLKDLTCIREDRILFEQLNYSINAGDIVQVEGPNGAGKTSLLRILAGLSAPYEGEVSFQGQSIYQESELYRQHLLYLGHLVGIKGELTAQENLMFNLAISGLDDQTAEDTLEQVDLLGFEDALASHLSAGQHRRIALAKLWQSQAKLWILDEPFTAIDKKGVLKLEQLMQSHADNGGAVILTTHQDLQMPTERYQKLTLEYRFF